MNHCRDRSLRIVFVSLGAAVVLLTAFSLAFDGAGLLNNNRSYLAFRTMALVILLISLSLVVWLRSSVGFVTEVIFLAVVVVGTAILGALESIPTSERKEFYLDYIHLRKQQRLLPSDLAVMRSHGARWQQVNSNTVRVWRTDGRNTCDVIVVILQDQTTRIRDIRFLGD